MTVTVLGMDGEIKAVSDHNSGKSEVGFLTVQLTVLGVGVVGGTGVLKGSNDGLAAVEIATLQIIDVDGGSTIADTTESRYYYSQLWCDFNPTGAGKIETVRLTVSGSGSTGA